MRLTPFLLISLLAAAPAQAKRIDLPSVSADAAEQLWGPVEVRVHDLRKQALPDVDGDLIGRGRVFSFVQLLFLGAGSRVRPMRLDHRSLPDLITDRVSAVATEAGLLARGATVVPPLAYLDVNVRRFWCQNPARRDERCYAELDLDLTVATSGDYLWSGDLSYRLPPWEGGNRQDSYLRLLHRLDDQLEMALAAGDVRTLVRGLAKATPGPVDVVSAATVLLEGEGSSLYTDLGGVPGGRCVTDGVRMLIVPRVGSVHGLELPAALYGTWWTTAWFDGDPATGLELHLPSGPYLFVGGLARRRRGTAAEGYGGGRLGFTWPEACGEDEVPGAAAELRPPGWISMHNLKEGAVRPASYVGGREDAHRWKTLRLGMDRKGLSVPAGVELLAERELTRRFVRLLGEQHRRARKHAETSGVAIGLGLAGASLLGVSAGLNAARRSERNLRQQVSLGAAEAGTRVAGALMFGFSWPIFIRASSQWSAADSYASGLRSDRWDLLASPGEISRAVLRHNRDLSVSESGPDR